MRPLEIGAVPSRYVPASSPQWFVAARVVIISTDLTRGRGTGLPGREVASRPGEVPWSQHRLKGRPREPGPAAQAPADSVYGLGFVTRCWYGTPGDACLSRPPFFPTPSIRGHCATGAAPDKKSLINYVRSKLGLVGVLPDGGHWCLSRPHAVGSASPSATRQHQVSTSCLAQAPKQSHTCFSP